MGNRLERSTDYIPDENIPEDNGIRFLDKPVPHEVLCHILLFVPPKDLILSATRVCQYWNGLLADIHFWLEKLQVEGIKLSETSRSRIMNEDAERSLRVLRILSSHCLPLNKNLLKNPSGVDGLKYWAVQHGGNHLEVETRPVGSDPIPDEAGLPTQHCFVTSYGTCVRQQEVNLVRLGFIPLVMEVLQPKIVISEWVSARWDCGSTSNLNVFLYGAESQSEVRLQWSSEDENVLRRQWYELKETITDYPKNLIKLKYISSGRDLQFWAGHYGAKSAGSSVKLVL